MRKLLPTGHYDAQRALASNVATSSNERGSGCGTLFVSVVVSVLSKYGIELDDLIPVEYPDLTILDGEMHMNNLGRMGPHAYFVCLHCHPGS